MGVMDVFAYSMIKCVGTNAGLIHTRRGDVNRILNGALKDIVKDGGGQTLDPSSTYASA